MHLVMFTENGRTVMKRVSSAEYAELKAARMATAEPAIAPAAVEEAHSAPITLDVPIVLKSLMESNFTA